MNTIDLKTLMGWNPCSDFPRERIETLFAGREKVTAADVFHVELLRQDEHLWVVLREAFFSPEELQEIALRFVLHVTELAHHHDLHVRHAVMNASMASTGNFELLPKDKRQERWGRGATAAERCAGLSALWAAQARAETQIKKEKRLREFGKERDWQIEHVKEKAGL